MEKPDLEVLMESLVFERPEPEIGVVVMQMEAKHVLVKVSGSNLVKQLYQSEQNIK